jgi:DNA-binding transcriptional ArsR family regulator
MEMGCDFENLALLFKALAHPVRVQIVAGLMKKDECHVNKMVEKLCLPQPVISQHLTVLKAAGIIIGCRRGNLICYKLVSEQVRTMLQGIEEHDFSPDPCPAVPAENEFATY